MSKRLSVLVAVVALAVGGAPLAVGAAPHHIPKKHGNAAEQLERQGRQAAEELPQPSVSLT